MQIQMCRFPWGGRTWPEGELFPCSLFLKEAKDQEEDINTVMTEITVQHHELLTLPFFGPSFCATIASNDAYLHEFLLQSVQEWPQHLGVQPLLCAHSSREVIPMAGRKKYAFICATLSSALITVFHSLLLQYKLRNNVLFPIVAVFQTLEAKDFQAILPYVTLYAVDFYTVGLPSREKWGEGKQ